MLTQKHHFKKLNKKLFLTTVTRSDYDFSNAGNPGYRNYATGRADIYNFTNGKEAELKYPFVVLT